LLAEILGAARTRHFGLPFVRVERHNRRDDPILLLTRNGAQFAEQASG
jgi:hypothetical protein